MQSGMHIFPQEVWKMEREEIPVDNSEFSTFSTSFSTGVFHRGCELWIFIFGSHKKNRRLSPDFPLFRGSWIFTMAQNLCKNLGLTRVGKADGCFVTHLSGYDNASWVPLGLLLRKNKPDEPQITGGYGLRKNLKKGVDFV